MGRLPDTLKLAAVALHDTFAALVVAVLVSCAFVVPAYAYVDPSVMTYTIQALAGVAVALGAVAGVAFRRTRRALMKALHIDENARKEIEPDVHRVQDGVVIRTDGELRQSPEEGKRKPKLRKEDESNNGLTWPWRIGLALVISFFTVGTVCFVAPCEIVAASSGSLIVSLPEVVDVLSMPCIVLAVALALVLSVTRGRLFCVLALLLFAVGLCCWCQAMFMNAGLPLADGGAVQWTKYQLNALTSFLVWTVIIVACGALALWLKRSTVIVASLCSVALLIIQFVGVVSLFNEQLTTASHVEVPVDQISITEEGLFNVSDSSNVIVFVLDTYDTQDIQQLLPAHPDMLDSFTGFTWYPDSTGSLIPTRYAVPYMLTGVEPNPQVDYEWGEYTYNRYPRGTFLEDVQKLGYSTGIYSDSVYYEDMDPELVWPLVASKTINIHGTDSESLNRESAIKALEKMALYRDAPWAFKPFLWFTTDDINNAMINRSPDIGDENTRYTIDDPAYYNKLKTRGLSVSDEGEARGSFRFIHLLGTHVPYTMNEKAEFVGEGGSSLESQALGSMVIVSEYLEQLKQLGLYDEATIIVTADHGYWYFTDHPLEKPSSPIMFVKPSQNHEEAMAPMQISSAPVSHMDFEATLIKAMGGDESKYGTAIWDVPEGYRTRTYYMTTSYNGMDDDIKQYEIVGDVLDMENWRLTGVQWTNIWGAHNLG